MMGWRHPASVRQICLWTRGGGPAARAVAGPAAGGGCPLAAGPLAELPVPPDTAADWGRGGGIIPVIMIRYLPPARDGRRATSPSCRCADPPRGGTALQRSAGVRGLPPPHCHCHCQYSLVDLFLARVMRGPPSLGGRLFFHDRRRPRSRHRPWRPRAGRRGHQSRRSPRPGERRAGATPPHRPTVLIGRWRGASAGRQRRRRGPTTAPPRRRSAAVVAVASCVICTAKRKEHHTCSCTNVSCLRPPT